MHGVRHHQAAFPQMFQVANIARLPRAARGTIGFDGPAGRSRLESSLVFRGGRDVFWKERVQGGRGGKPLNWSLYLLTLKRTTEGPH